MSWVRHTLPGSAYQRLSAIVIGFLFAALIGEPAAAQSMRGNAAAGRLYAVNMCTGCHSVVPATDGVGLFAPDFTKIARSPTTTRASLRAYLRSDHDLMPNFNMKRDEIENIVAYIMSLRRR
jgi:mono/diheme cytochrome c family protein